MAMITSDKVPDFAAVNRQPADVRFVAASQWTALSSFTVAMSTIAAAGVAAARAPKAWVDPVTEQALPQADEDVEKDVVVKMQPLSRQNIKVRVTGRKQAEPRVVCDTAVE